MHRQRFRIAACVVAACAAVLLAQLPASSAAINVSGTPTPVTGNATWFSGLGGPYGGCGTTTTSVDSQNYIALNVQNSPGVYSMLPRPISAANASEIGMWDNGLNCGRWVKVTIGPNCNGVNDGAQNEPFCRGGAGYVADQFDGATLDMVVADSCDDTNAWCKDDPYHIDLHQSSLNSFVLNGQPVGTMYPGSWNNRQVTWQFEPAPNYTGDINIGALQGAQPYWPAISVTHLANGIHGVQYYANGTWTSATMDGDMGDDYIVAPTTGAGTGGSFYEIRVVDASGNLINNGRVYNFSLPSSCPASGCTPAYTSLSYTTSTAPVAPPPGTGSCTLAAPVVTNSWPGGYQLQLTVTNSGTTALTGWTAGFTFADTTETIASSWNATVTQSGEQVTASNAGYNGSVAAGASTTFGVVVNGSNSTLSGLTCGPA